MPDIKTAIVTADEETSPTTSTAVLPLVNETGTTFKKIKIATLFAAMDALVYKGVIDCSANPNYPAADAGHVYKVSVAGKIGGASGPAVQVGDTLICNTDGSAAGDHATVGSNWSIIQTNINLAAVVLTDAATIATDAGLGNKFRVTLGGNRTLGNPTNPYDGQQCVWELIQDGTGSRTLTLGTKFALGADISNTTLSTAANKRDFLTAVYNATADKWYVVGFVKGY